MIAPVFKGEGRLAYEELPNPVVRRDDDVVVDPLACGICGTDLNILAVPPAHSGARDIVIGHEAVGVVRDVGTAVTALQRGQRVVIAPRLTCGACAYCRMGFSNQCTNYTTIGTTRHGAFAPRIVLPERALYAIDPSLPADDALFFEPLSCVVGAARRAPCAPGDTVLIIGGGPMGALFALLYRAMGARRVWIADISPKRLAFFERHDIAIPIDATKTAPRDIVMDETSIGADIVIDAVGTQLDTALQCVRRAGNIVLFGLRPHDTSAIRQYAVTRHDITIHGVFVGLHPFIDTIRILESGLIAPSILITHTVPLNRLSDGVELMRSAKAMKVKVAIQP